MKKLITIFGAILFVSTILASCGEDNKSEVSENNSKSEELAQQKEQEKLANLELNVCGTLKSQVGQLFFNPVLYGEIAKLHGAKVQLF